MGLTLHARPWRTRDGGFTTFARGVARRDAGDEEE
jgi:hypothetical protein